MAVSTDLRSVAPDRETLARFQFRSVLVFAETNAAPLDWPAIRVGRVVSFWSFRCPGDRLGPLVKGVAVGDSADWAGLARELAEQTRQAFTVSDVDAALELVVDLAVRTLQFDFAGVTQRLPDGTFTTSAPSAKVVVEADKLQYELLEGPCVDAVFHDETLYSEDLSVEQRWPRWSPGVKPLGIASVLSVHLYTVGKTTGALNLYSTSPRTYNAEELAAAKVVGAHASVSLAHFRSEQQLWKAIDARHQIGMAQGILMNKYSIGPTQSFAVLTRLSQAHNVKLHLLADQIVSAGTLPDFDDPGPGKS